MAGARNEDHALIAQITGLFHRLHNFIIEQIDNGRPPKLRGLQAFRFSGAMRTLAQLLRRACTFVLDATYTLGKLQTVRT